MILLLYVQHLENGGGRACTHSVCVNDIYVEEGVALLHTPEYMIIVRVIPPYTLYQHQIDSPGRLAAVVVRFVMDHIGNLYCTW